MANIWDPIDPEDIVDLWVDFGDATKPFLPATEVITAHSVSPPAEVTTVASDLDTTNKKIRWRTGPNPVGTYPINYHITTNSNQEYDVDVWLTVKERVKKS